MALGIALCITELEVGGAERALVELARGLDRQKFAVVVYSLAPRPTGNRAALADELDRAGIEAHYLAAHSAWALPSTLRRLTRLFAAQRPDLVQTFLFHAGVVGSWAARRAGVPHVVTGIRVAERRAWHRCLMRRTARWAERHVCVSQAVADFTARVTRLDPQSLLVIPNGVDAARFDRARPADLVELGVPAGRSVFVCIGRLDPQKGIDWLLDLLPGVFARQQSHDLLLVGSGPQRAALERQAQQLGIAGRLHFVGQRTDIATILAASDLAVLPSRFEGMSNVLLEAMAAGRAVVATGVEGVTEALGPAAGGQLVPAGDAQAFANTLLALLVDGSLRARLGAENARRTGEHFTLQRMVRSYEQLYQSLV